MIDTPTSRFWLKSDWAPLFLVSVVISSMVLWRLSLFETIDGPAVSSMIQYSVWWSVPWLYMAFVTSPIRTLFPGRISNCLMRYRRFSGLCFSIGMAWQLTFIIWLVYGYRDYYVQEVYLLSDVIIQIPGYAFLIAMTLTSPYPVRRRMNSQHWRIIHKVGIYFLWQTVWSTYWYEIYYYEDIQKIDYFYYWLGFFVWLLRPIAWVLEKDLTSTGNIYIYVLAVLSSLAVIFGSIWAESVMNFFASNSVLVTFEILVPFLPVFFMLLGIVAVARWAPKKLSD